VDIRNEVRTGQEFMLVLTKENGRTLFIMILVLIFDRKVFIEVRIDP
jgi:hypothetical protein